MILEDEQATSKLGARIAAVLRPGDVIALSGPLGVGKSALARGILEALGHRVLGTEQTIAEMKSGQMRDYFNHWYSADNAVVAMAGKVDFDAMVKRIEQWCGKWQRTGAKRSAAVAAIQPDELIIKSDKVHVQYGMMLCPAPALQDDHFRFARGCAESYTLASAWKSRCV